MFVDTDVVVSFLRNRPQAVEFIAGASRQGRIRVAFPTACELLEGASMGGKGEERRVGAFLGATEVVFPTLNTARIFAKTAVAIAIRGEPLPDFDVLIASTAVEYGEPLATRNLKHFSRIPGLNLAATW